ncbi:MAG: hypothetical protein DSM106950_01095 [Stigonema ocellatum SAG 48.90 = DSM 106950]|nr:hypothetical protein [Stigonema ocellatum SAG 48.90 = DSM 106950]
MSQFTFLQAEFPAIYESAVFNKTLLIIKLVRSKTKFWQMVGRGTQGRYNPLCSLTVMDSQNASVIG